MTKPGNSLLTTSSRYAWLASGLALSVLGLSLSHEASALPTDGQVTAGQATITTTGNQTNIHQATDKAIINWNNFDTLAGETTRFYQPGQNSIALNRVNSGTPTHIDGNLFANGNVWVVNGSGVVFGQNANVNVGGLLATTANISDSNFLSGNYRFSEMGHEGASVINKGRITAAQGGLVALVAPNVKNEGIIRAKMGKVALGGAETFTLDMYGDNLLSFAVPQGELGMVRGPRFEYYIDENGVAQCRMVYSDGYTVTNTGAIVAQGGAVQLTADSARGLMDSVVNTTGAIDVTASQVGGKAGTITIDAGTGIVNAGGTVNAHNVYGKGGDITIVGKTINLLSSFFGDVTGALGGGTFKAGGDYQGGGTLPHADYLNVAEGAKVDASAKFYGDGGTAIFWSDKKTDFNGSVKARGGAIKGDGGLIEISSKGKLNFNWDADSRATNGKAGMLLLDPDNVRIIPGNTDPTVDDINTYFYAGRLADMLNGGQNVGLAANHDLYVDAAIISSGSGSLTLNGYRNLFVNAALQTGSGSITLGTGTTAGINALNVNASITTGSGNITLNNTGATGSINLTGSVNTTSGDIFINPEFGSFFSGGGALNNSLGKTTVRVTTLGSIQEAVDSIGTTSPFGATIKVTEGTFDQDTVITHNDIILTGVKDQTFLNGSIGVNGARGIDITGFHFTGGDGVVFTGGSGAVQHNVFEAGSKGIRMVGTDGSQILNNTFNGVQDTAIGVEGSSGIYIYKNIIEGADGGIDVRNSSGRINSTEVTSANDFGIYAENFVGEIHSNNIDGIGKGAALSVINSGGVLVTRNNIGESGNGGQGDGIFISGAPVQLLSNSVKNVDVNGVVLAAGANGTLVDSNDIQNVGGNGILVQSGGNKLVNNIINGAALDGISVVGTGSGGVQVLSNRITGTGRDGISLTNAWGSETNSNSLYGIGGVGIFLEASDENTVINNYIEGSSRGIVVSNSNGAGKLIGSNFIRASSHKITVNGVVLNVMPSGTIENALINQQRVEDNSTF